MDSALKARLDAISSWKDKINADAKKKGTGMTVLKSGEVIPWERIPTGSPALDIKLGGGWPKSKIIEIFGPEGSGKSTLAYQAIAELHRRDPGAVALLVDVEGTYSSKRGAAMGIDPERLEIMKITTAEGMVDAVKDLMSEQVNGKSIINLVVVDSVAALVPSAEDEAEMGDALVGVLARMMSRACRVWSAIADRGGTTIIFINQTREKIGIMYGNPETTPGGKALPFYARTRVRTSKIKPIKAGDDEIGQETKAILKKSSLDDAAGGETYFHIYRRNGVDAAFDLWRMGIPLGVITKNANALSVKTPDGEIKGAGKDAFIEAVRAASPAAQMWLYDEVVKAALNTVQGKAAIDQLDDGAPGGGADGPAEGEVDAGLEAA